MKCLRYMAFQTGEGEKRTQTNGYDKSLLLLMYHGPFRYNKHKPIATTLLCLGS